MQGTRFFEQPLLPAVQHLSTDRCLTLRSSFASLHHVGPSALVLEGDGDGSAVHPDWGSVPILPRPPLSSQTRVGAAYSFTWGLFPQAKPKETKALGDGNRGCSSWESSERRGGGGNKFPDIGFVLRTRKSGHHIWRELCGYWRLAHDQNGADGAGERVAWSSVRV